MINQLFQQSEPSFVSIKGDYFIVNQKPHSHLMAQIHDFLPIRKLFINAKLSCYSLNNKTGKHRQYCALCRQRFRCQPRLRLMILILNVEKEPIPAILEINRNSFDLLDTVIQQIGKDNLQDTTISMKIILTSDDRSAIEFLPE